MQKLKLVDLKQGMVLAQKVKDQNGRTLLLPETALSDKNIRVFKAWGISEAFVKSPGDGPIRKMEEAVSGTEENKEFEKELIEIFIHTDPRHPAIKELFSVCLKNKRASNI